MKKIAITTLNGYYNYGNRLQNYALQETLISFGFEVETIINNTENYEKNTNILKKISKIRKKSLFEIISKVLKLIESRLFNKKNQNLEITRTKIFKDFTLKYIKETSYSISVNNLPVDLTKKYDYFVTGSDQVWNPGENRSLIIYFLTFAEKKKRIAYAPSFGIAEIEQDLIKNYEEWLSGMNFLSVREEEGAKLISQIINKEVPVLVDPTMLLSKEKWLSVSKPAINRPTEKYLLTYFLGEIPKDYKKQIEKMALENKLQIINLGTMKEKDTYQTGPSEFIDYINNCAIFCTDSFHGIVFSILLEKPFIAYKRIGGKSMYSRIETLLNKCGLVNRENETVMTNDIFSVDYSNVRNILENERKKSIKFLQDALGIS